MQPTYKPVILILLLIIITGCAIKHDYVWKEYPIKPERISSQTSFTEGQGIRIIKGKSNDATICLGIVGVHAFYGNEQSLTDSIVDQLAKEMRKKGLEIKNTAEKSLEITVNHSIFEPGTWKRAAIIDYTVKFGNGKAKFYTVRNSSPGPVYRIYNGAVALAVIEIINDQEVLNYIR